MPRSLPTLTSAVSSSSRSPGYPEQLYGTITVPPAVQGELEEGIRLGVDAPDVSSLDWVQVLQVTSAALAPALVDLGPGEAEVIALGLEMANSLIILDDQLARRIADLHSLKYTGTLGVLVKAKQGGLISLVSAVVTTYVTKACG